MDKEIKCISKGYAENTAKQKEKILVKAVRDAIKSKMCIIHISWFKEESKGVYDGETKNYLDNIDKKLFAKDMGKFIADIKEYSDDAEKRYKEDGL